MREQGEPGDNAEDRCLAFGSSSQGSSGYDRLSFGRRLQSRAEKSTSYDAPDGHNASVPSQAFEQAWKRILHQTIPAQGLGY